MDYFHVNPTVAPAIFADPLDLKPKARMQFHVPQRLSVRCVCNVSLEDANVPGSRLCRLGLGSGHGFRFAP